MTDIIKFQISPRRRANLLKLADYLESLPKRYKHFEMGDFTSHKGGCSLAKEIDDEKVREVCEEFEENGWGRRRTESTLYARSIDKFLNNCGTSACALGHGPAAGIPLAKSHIETERMNGASIVTGINWGAYTRNFLPCENDMDWEFLFGGDWAYFDNHHWGAAARIRYVLDNGGIPAEKDKWGDLEPMSKKESIRLYKPYRVDQRLAAAAS